MRFLSLVFSSNIQNLMTMFAITTFVAIITVSSHIEVPFYPVPMTLQTLAVLATGLALGFRNGTAAIGIFLTLGALGLPVFAGGKAGLMVFAGPTGGYLIGFAIAVAFCGWARDRGWVRNVPGACLTALFGAALVYPTGLIVLGSVVGWDKPVLDWGLYPFIAGDVAKALLAGLGVPLVGRFLQR